MGAVIEMGNRIEAPLDPNSTRIRPPRRTVHLGDRAPVVLDTSAQRVGTSVTVDGLPSQASVVRRHLRTVAALSPREMDMVESLASELFNNSLLHTRSGAPGGEIVVTVTKLPGTTQVKIIDQGPRAGASTSPHLRPQDPDREGGFGLHLVESEADRWGTLHDNGRTTVWFEVDRPRHADGTTPGCYRGW